MAPPPSGNVTAGSSEEPPDGPLPSVPPLPGAPRPLAPPPLEEGAPTCDWVPGARVCTPAAPSGSPPNGCLIASPLRVSRKNLSRPLHSRCEHPLNHGEARRLRLVLLENGPHLGQVLLDPPARRGLREQLPEFGRAQVLSPRDHPDALATDAHGVVHLILAVGHDDDRDLLPD